MSSDGARLVVRICIFLGGIFDLCNWTETCQECTKVHCILFAADFIGHLASSALIVEKFLKEGLRILA